MTNENLNILKKIFEEKMPYHNHLGMKFHLKENERPHIRIDMQEQFIGNFVHGILHGGVISSTLDVIGGLTALLGAADKCRDDQFEEFLGTMNNLGTIDLRIDYLRPGRGKYFLATGSVLRTGKKISVTRMEMHNDENLLIAVGSATYLVG